MFLFVFCYAVVRDNVFMMLWMDTTNQIAVFVHSVRRQNFQKIKILYPFLSVIASLKIYEN